jgi:predicted DNA-binding protein
MPRVREFERQLAFKVSPEQDEFLREMSERLGVSQGWVAREALRRFMLEITTQGANTDVARLVTHSEHAAD